MLDSLLFNSMQVTRDQLYDVRQPVLANRGNHIDGNLVFDVLPVAVVGDAAGVDAVRIRMLRVHDSVILLRFVSRLCFTLLDDVELRAGFIDVLIAHDSSLDVNVETFA